MKKLLLALFVITASGVAMTAQAWRGSCSSCRSCDSCWNGGGCDYC